MINDIRELKETTENNSSTLDSLGKRIQDLQSLFDRSLAQIISNRLSLETFQNEVRKLKKLIDKNVKGHEDMLQKLQETLEVKVNDLDVKYEYK